MSLSRSIVGTRGWLVAIIAGWLALVLGGTVALARYKEKPGVAANAPGGWPAESTIRRTPGKPTLVMLAHPMCPCTRASIAELAKLMSRLDGQLSSHVVFIRPEGTPHEWETSDLWDHARAIPGVEVAADPDGVEAERFGGATSGQVLLYDADGRLEFAGGITPARGHEGDSPGAERVVALVTGHQADAATAPVFGCPLQGEDSPGSER